MPPFVSICFFSPAWQLVSSSRGFAFLLDLVCCVSNGLCVFAVGTSLFLFFSVYLSSRSLLSRRIIKNDVTFSRSVGVRVRSTTMRNISWSDQECNPFSPRTFSTYNSISPHTHAQKHEDTRKHTQTHTKSTDFHFLFGLGCR